MIPTKFIDEDEFIELMNQEDGVIPRFLLTAIPFNPPTEDGDGIDTIELPQVNVLMVNVAEPCLYKDKELGMGFVLIPGYDQERMFTWEQFQDCHVVKGAWAYRLAPYGWEAGDWDYDLDHAAYRFNHGEVDEWKEVGD